MTDEQKKARRQSAESGPIKWIKDNCLRTAESGEDYVFISYKSDDYERALDDILYQTCRKYGLRVYFDVAFDDGADSWINQFYDNMCSNHCKAMIAFLSNKYYSSYATLLEMMARKTHAAGGDYEYDTLFFLPINLERIKDQLDEGNTGLGTERFSDGTINRQAAKELAQFNEIFEQLVSQDNKLSFIYRRFKDQTLYREATQTLPKSGAPYLSVTQCRKLMGLVCPDCNENDGGNKAFMEAIHDKLVNAGLGSVFIPNWVPPDDSDPIVDPPEPAKVISLPDFQKTYNMRTFRKNTFQKFRLVGRGDCEKYSTEFFDSASSLTRSFIRKVLEEQGLDYISRVVQKNDQKKNPPFITEEQHQIRIERGDSVKYQKLDIPGLKGWSMCTHYGQYAWISDVLCKRILDLGLSLEDFSLKYILSHAEETGGEAGPTEPDELTEDEETSGGITGPRPLDGKEAKRKRTLECDGYSFTLYGEREEHLSLKNMMLTVFEKTLDRHPDKLDLLVDGLPCLERGDLSSARDVSSIFRAGMVHTVDGTVLSIGTSLGRDQVLSYIGRLMRMCGEPKESLVIDGYDY